MKAICFVLVLVACFFLRQGLVYADVEKNMSEKGNIFLLFDGQSFTFQARCAYPMGGSMVSLTYPYTLKLGGDSIDVHLPYYGRAYQTSYAGGGIDFSGKIKDYASEEKGDTFILNFEAGTSDDLYQFHLEIEKDASANLTVTMRNRQMIRFDGEIVATELQKK